MFNYKKINNYLTMKGFKLKIGTNDMGYNEIYYDLFINNKKVGHTELNPENNEIEIITYNESNFNIVKNIVKNNIIVWAWF